MERVSLVPELVVSNFEASLAFYLQTLGFKVQYRHRAPGFAYLEREGAQVMLEERQADSWVLGALSQPFGRGMNLRIACADIAALRAQVAAADWAVYRELEDVWYEAGPVQVGHRQFMVADPDGYLLRFNQSLGERRPIA
jgi:catechol 2,3-dioxygenase-like lactoylglutathione lyase family enzyme